MDSDDINNLFDTESEISTAMLKTAQAESLLCVLDRYYFNRPEKDAVWTLTASGYDEAAALLAGAVDALREGKQTLNSAMVRIDGCIDGCAEPNTGHGGGGAA